MVGMPRFSIKELMLAITLIAIGLSVCLAIVNYGGHDMSLIERPRIALVAFGIGGIMIGAGVMAPFHRKVAGAQIGLILVGVLLAILAVMGY
jgi:hypothetical protein